MRNAIIVDREKLVYYFIHKCASSSLKTYFADLIGLHYNKDHPLGAHLAPFRRCEASDAVKEYPHYHHFAVVRNPISRLLSLYCDKIDVDMKKIEASPELYTPLGVESYVFARYGNKFRREMSVEQFIHSICSIPDNMCESHFCPQYLLLPPLNSHVPMTILQLEELRYNIQAIRGVLDGVKELPVLNVTEQRKMKSAKLLVDQSLHDAIREKYRWDFELFGY